ncbi:MAG: trehalose-6-phosphate synthase, partial [Pseudolabrys sp.]
MARLVIVSNRVGIPDRGARPGGLEVAIRPALKRHGGLWFGWSGRVAEDVPQSVKIAAQDNITYATVDLAKDDY